MTNLEKIIQNVILVSALITISRFVYKDLRQSYDEHRQDKLLDKIRKYDGQ